MRHAGAGGFAAFLILVAMAGTGGAGPGEPQPLKPPPPAAALADGLSVRYYVNRFQHTDELAAYMKSDPGRRGAPLPHLNYPMGEGNVLGSGASDTVGAHISGLMLFQTPATYRLRITSNDGVRLMLGGVVLYEDPEVHPDSTSPPLPVVIAQAGYYPIDVLYYEKKGTATLILEWQPPNTEHFTPVPAAAFKHQP